MNIPLTSQLLGDLIEKGYTHMLASTSANAAGDIALTLHPVRKKPDVFNLPEGYDTFYKITREPIVMACENVDHSIVVSYTTINNDITPEDIFNDSYFRMSEEFFEQVLDSIEDYAVFTTDKNGDITSWNTGAGKVLGYTAVETIGESSSIFFTPEDREKGEPERELKAATDSGRAIDERHHLRKDGTTFWGSGLVFPLYDEEHRHRGFTKIMRNLGERKASERTAAAGQIQ